MIKILNHKTEIVISLITGMLIFYLQPLLGYLGNYFVKTILFISDKFSNYYYQSISKNDTNIFSEMNSIILNYFISIFFIGFIIYFREKRKKLQSDIDDSLSSISKTKEKLEELNSDENKKSIKSKEELLEEITVFVESTKSMRDSIYKKDNYTIFLSITSAFLILLLFSTNAINSSISKENLIFKNDLIKIAPYTSDSVVIKIRSDWARIENSKDFDHIKKNIENLKKNNKIK